MALIAGAGRWRRQHSNGDEETVWERLDADGNVVSHSDESEDRRASKGSRPPGWTRSPHPSAERERRAR
jgi:hypothetical protein